MTYSQAREVAEALARPGTPYVVAQVRPNARTGPADYAWVALPWAEYRAAVAAGLLFAGPASNVAALTS